MVSRKSLPNGNIYDQDSPYRDSGLGKAESTKRKNFSSLTDPELEKHWKEIFESPEADREFNEEDFKPLLFKPGEFDLSSAQEDKKRKTPVVSKLMTETFSNKLQILREAIDEIDREIEKRIELGKSFRTRIDEEIFKCQTLLKHIENYTIGYNPNIEFRRLGLERQIFLLTKEIRSEELRAWEDLASLLKDRRAFVMEYESLLNTRKVLDRK